ncbi:cytoplasmic phosphatidylinositol transfer protein 1 isoform X1 [Malaya genurostris]|uniref:cytoplasmic phosphatidylinositol transfer protein 1 isoform X1 n=1 Tax=Malaya genurostris TaxID=325434 RepID=UPI0026F3F6C9|nr:cytoplasmic phosphatidylinositol transfer protein 1 isoform X1 [Malaya genurostris]
MNALTLYMVKANSQKRGFISRVVYHTGSKPSVQKYSMLLKEDGTTIHLLLLCSFIPKLNIKIHTKFENDPGTSENCLNIPHEKLEERLVDFVDIAFDELNGKHYKEDEDPKFFKSALTGRGPLLEGWKQTDEPIMCSYKLVQVSFEVWGLQTKVEDFIHNCIRDILLLGHRQAFVWIDEWHWMSIDDVRKYESEKQKEANRKVLQFNELTSNMDDID